MLLLGKGKAVTASKQDTDILAFLCGLALSQASGWLERRLIVGLDAPIHLFQDLLSLSLCTLCFSSVCNSSGTRRQVQGKLKEGEQESTEGQQSPQLFQMDRPEALLPQDQQDWS